MRRVIAIRLATSPAAIPPMPSATTMPYPVSSWSGGTMTVRQVRRERLEEAAEADDQEVVLVVRPDLALMGLAGEIGLDRRGGTASLHRRLGGGGRYSPVSDSSSSSSYGSWASRAADLVSPRISGDRPRGHDPHWTRHSCGMQGKGRGESQSGHRQRKQPRWGSAAAGRPRSGSGRAPAGESARRLRSDTGRRRSGSSTGGRCTGWPACRRGSGDNGRGRRPGPPRRRRGCSR